MATFKRVGFGQVEPNHLSAQRTAQIYAQLPAASSIKVLENGQFVKYDYAHDEVNFSGDGEWMMVFNEVKLYDDFWRESYKDFAMIKSDYVGGEIYPRLFKTNIGDIYNIDDIKLEVLHVGSDNNDLNNSSLVLKITINKINIF